MAKPRKKISDGKHTFMDPADRARIAARWEKEPQKKLEPGDPDAKRKLADYHLARKAAEQGLPTFDVSEDVQAGRITPEALEKNNKRALDWEALEVMDTNQRRGKKPLNFKRALATVKRRSKPPTAPTRPGPQPHDNSTLAAFERKYGEKMRRLATGWAPYRAPGKTRGRGISLKRFAEQSRPAKGQKRYTDSDREAFADKAQAARDLLDVFAVQHMQHDLAKRAVWQASIDMQGRNWARKARRKQRAR